MSVKILLKVGFIMLLDIFFIMKQEVTGKILECVSTIAGSRLEPTTWLRRNLTVRPDLASEDQETEDNGKFNITTFQFQFSSKKEKIVTIIIERNCNVI